MPAERLADTARLFLAVNIATERAWSGAQNRWRFRSSIARLGIVYGENVINFELKAYERAEQD